MTGRKGKMTNTPFHVKTLKDIAAEQYGESYSLTIPPCIYRHKTNKDVCVYSNKFQKCRYWICPFAGKTIDEIVLLKKQGKKVSKNNHTNASYASLEKRINENILLKKVQDWERNKDIIYLSEFKYKFKKEFKSYKCNINSFINKHYNNGFPKPVDRVTVIKKSVKIDKCNKKRDCLNNLCCEINYAHIVQLAIIGILKANLLKKDLQFNNTDIVIKLDNLYNTYIDSLPKEIICYDKYKNITNKKEYYKKTSSKELNSRLLNSLININLQFIEEIENNISMNYCNKYISIYVNKLKITNNYIKEIHEIF